MAIREDVIASITPTTEREVTTRIFGEAEVRQFYINKAKADSQGQGRINPMMIGATADFDGDYLHQNQLEQILHPRGYATDISSNVFLTPAVMSSYQQHHAELTEAVTVETATAAKSLSTETESLVGAEYFNRKAIAVADAVEKRILRLMDGGITREEATQVVAYNADRLDRERRAEWHRMNSYKLFTNEDPNRHHLIDDELLNRRYSLPLYKAQAIEDHINTILEAKEPGWEARVIRLREEQARLLKMIEEPVEAAVIEPPPPPPVMDFSTGDLEMPARFIIKDLKGFEFNPDTKFDGLRLPYDSCLFVLGNELKAVVLATQEDDDVITLKLLSETKTDIPWHATATLYVRLHGDRARLKWGNTQRTLDKRLGMVSSILAFIAGEQLDEVEIETVITAPERDVPPPKPGNSYNVVSITQGRRGKRTDWKGGTHASPREHRRKGFWWPGKHGPIWIKATTVNKGVLGKVDKEYHVTKHIEEAS